MRDSYKVLLVDDSVANRKLVRITLAKAGYEVEEAEKGQQAIEMFMMGDYDLVITDIQMPEMDGFQLTALIRTCGIRSDTPILALTAHAMNGTRETCLRAGLTGYLSIPVDLRLLVNTVDDLVLGCEV